MKQKDYRLAAIMFTDIRGFSRMMEKDEAGTLKLLHLHNDLVVKIVKAHNGTVIKTIGDAFLIDFKNTVEALQSALEIQDKLYEYNKEHADFPLLLRIGLHLGDIYFYENDALGEGINIASRLQSIAHPGCICMSQEVYNHVLNKIDFQAAKLGRVSLKNISKEIHAYEITTPNVEFDPEHGKPRPGYKPGTYAQGGAGQDEMEFHPEQSGTAAMAEAQEDAQQARDAIKRSILNDIKIQGRRLSVDEVMQRYGSYGPDVEIVIKDLAEKGILQRGQAAPSCMTGRSGEGPRGMMGSGRMGGMMDEGGMDEARMGGMRARSYTERFMKIGEKIVDEVTKGIEEGLSRSSDPDAQAARRKLNGFRQGFSSSPQENPPSSFADQASPPAIHFNSPSPPRPQSSSAFPEHSFQARPEMTDEFADPRVKAINSKWERKLANSPFSSVKENFIQDFSIFRDSVAAGAKRSKMGFIPNLASWIGVSGLLFFINVMTKTPPWALIPFFAWGIGVVEHFFAVGRKAAKAAELSKMPVLNPDQLTLFKRLNLAKDAFVYHGVSTVSVSILLGVINGFAAFVGGPAFPWALFPVAALVFSFISHSAVHFPRLKQLEQSFIKSLGLSGSWKDLFGGKAEQLASIPQGPYQEAFAEALSIKAGIVEQLKKDKKKHGPVDKDLIPALEEYVGQIRLLATRAGEVDVIVDSIPMSALKSDKEELARKEAASSNERMKREYRKSIEEIERQETSFQELENQREMLKLRLKSGVNSLNQMRIEVARLSTMPEMDEDSTVLMLKQKSVELSQYLGDLSSGFADQEYDPYAELAEAERKQAESRALQASSTSSLPEPIGAESSDLSSDSAQLDGLTAELASQLRADSLAPAPESIRAESSAAEATTKAAPKPRRKKSTEA